jgi:integrase
MDRRKNGIRKRGNSIQIDFYYQGVRCRETIALEPTRANLNYASNLKAAIKHEIALGTFDYAKHFPNSSRAYLGSKHHPQKLTKLFDDFLLAKQRSTAFSTWRDYRSAIEYHLRPTFGDKYIQEMTTSDINNWMAGLDISNKRINNILVPLRGIFSDAFMDGRIEKNPMDRIKNLSCQTEEPRPLSPDEIESLLSHSDGQVKNLFQFAIWTGLRTSELIALLWTDINWNKKTVLIQRARVRGQIKQTKTKAGQREIMLLPPALEALIDQKTYTLLQGTEIFQNPKTGKCWENDSQIRKTAWIPAIKRAEIPYRNPYQTRHTYASMLLSAGEEPMWVAQQMGHKDWGMIRKRYGRWIPDIKHEAGYKINKLWKNQN